MTRATEVPVVKIALIGALAGTMSGLLGVGGGVVMVPLLVLVSSLSQHETHATALAAIVPIGAAGVIPFALEGRVSYALAALLAAGSLVGAPLGARIMARTREAELKIAFGLLMLVIGGQMLWS